MGQVHVCADLRVLTNRIIKSVRPWINCAPQHVAVSLDLKRHCTEADSAVFPRWKAAHHPYTQNNKSRWHILAKCIFGGKVHFCDQKCTLPAFTGCQIPFGKPFFGPNCVQLWSLLAVFWFQKPPNGRRRPYLSILH